MPNRPGSTVPLAVMPLNGSARPLALVVGGHLPEARGHVAGVLREGVRGENRARDEGREQGPAGQPRHMAMLVHSRSLWHTPELVHRPAQVLRPASIRRCELVQAVDVRLGAGFDHVGGCAAARSPCGRPASSCTVTSPIASRAAGHRADLVAVEHGADSGDRGDGPAHRVHGPVADGRPFFQLALTRSLHRGGRDGGRAAVDVQVLELVVLGTGWISSCRIAIRSSSKTSCFLSATGRKRW